MWFIIGFVLSFAVSYYVLTVMAKRRKQAWPTAPRPRTRPTPVPDNTARMPRPNRPRAESVRRRDDDDTTAVTIADEFDAGPVSARRSPDPFHTGRMRDDSENPARGFATGGRMTDDEPRGFVTGGRMRDADPTPSHHHSHHHSHDSGGDSGGSSGSDSGSGGGGGGGD